MQALSTAADSASPLAFAWHSGRREWTNFSFRRHRHFDVFFVTMHQSGTHWLKYLLTLALVHDRKLTPPTSISDNIVIGGPREREPIMLSPRLGQSHTIANPLLRYAMAIGPWRFPRYIILVRDIRDVLLAHYRKWQDKYDCDFSEYLRGDVTHHRFEKDVWWDFRFLNAWGAIMSCYPERVIAVQYESLQSNTAAVLNRIIDFAGIEFADRDAAIAHAIAGADKRTMASQDVQPYGMPVVNDEQRDWNDWYAAGDREWLSAACARYLKHDFGYDYQRWD